MSFSAHHVCLNPVIATKNTQDVHFITGEAGVSITRAHASEGHTIPLRQRKMTLA